MNRFWCDPKLAQALGWGPTSKREVETAMVVFVLPVAELLSELGRGPEDHAPVELVFVCPMAALDLSIGLGVAPRNLPVDDPEIPQVPGKVGPKLGAWSVWMRWMAIGRRRRTSSTNSVADLMEL